MAGSDRFGVADRDRFGERVHQARVAAVVATGRGHSSRLLRGDHLGLTQHHGFKARPFPVWL
jgi:hypothetical protein